MANLTILGQTSLCGVSVPNIYGGFGDDRKTMLAKTVAELHGRKLHHVNELINNNRKRFLDGVHILDIKQHPDIVIVLTDNKCMTNMEVGKAENIYLLSERGYVRLLKIMDDDTAWEKWDVVESEYFGLKEAKEASKARIGGELWTEYLVDVLEHNLATARKFGELTGMNLNAAYLIALTQTEQQTGEDLSAYKAMVNKASLVNPSQQARKNNKKYLPGTGARRLTEGKLHKEQDDLPPKKAYTAEEARKLIGLGRNTFMNMLHSDKIKGVKAGSKWIVPTWAIDEFLGAQIKSPN